MVWAGQGSLPEAAWAGWYGLSRRACLKLLLGRRACLKHLVRGSCTIGCMAKPSWHLNGCQKIEFAFQQTCIGPQAQGEPACGGTTQDDAVHHNGVEVAAAAIRYWRSEQIASSACRAWSLGQVEIGHVELVAIALKRFELVHGKLALAVGLILSMANGHAAELDQVMGRSGVGWS